VKFYLHIKSSYARIKVLSAFKSYRQLTDTSTLFTVALS